MRKPMIENSESRLRQGVERANSAGASAAKLSLGHSESTHCSFERGRLKETGSSESLSYNVEVLVDGRCGTSSGNRIEKLDEMIDRAIVLAKVGSTAHFNAYPPPGALTPVKTHSERTLGLARERMIESCGQMVEALREYDPDLFISATGSRNESEDITVTTGGVCHQASRTAWSLSSHVQRTKGTDILFAGYGRGWCDLNEFYAPSVIAGRVLVDLRNAEKTVEPPTGKVKAYIPPEQLPAFLMPFMAGINGRNVAKGDSPLAGRLGEQVLAKSITIVDHPHVDYASGACEIDSDGIPTRKQTLFENGVLRRFLYDLDTAGLAGAEPTGNSGCYPYWLLVTPGVRPSSELLADIDDGIYIKALIGYGQGNIINGDFSCNVGLGYRIHNGEITGRIKDTMIAGNLYDLFAENVELSSDLDHAGRMPHAVIEGLSVASRSA